MGGFPVQDAARSTSTPSAPAAASIAWIDAGGLLKVGPQSAGAYPGPGLLRPRWHRADRHRRRTVVLGRLNPEGVARRPHGDASPTARKRRSSGLRAKLGVDRTRAAAGVVEIINVNMMGAVRVISVEQGEDPRDFTLVAFGGAGPLHAADVARQHGDAQACWCRRDPGCSRRGPAACRRARRLQPDAPRRAPTPQSLARSTRFRDARRARRAVARGRGDEARRTYGWFARSALPRPELRAHHWSSTAAMLDPRRSRDSSQASTAATSDYYGYDMREQPVEIVNLRLVVTGERAWPADERAIARAARLNAAVLGKTQGLVSRRPVSSRRRSMIASGLPRRRTHCRPGDHRADGHDHRRAAGAHS